MSVLYNLAECIRIVTILLKPFMPALAPRVSAQLGVDLTNATWADATTWAMTPAGTKVSKGDALFPRVDPASIEIPVEEVAPAVTFKEEISFDDFSKTEMMVGEIIECRKHPKADKLLISQIDFGGEVRQIVSGIAQFYKPEELKGRKVVAVLNLEPRKIRGEESMGMLLCAEDKEGRIEVLQSELPAGSKIR